MVIALSEMGKISGRVSCFFGQEGHRESFKQVKFKVPNRNLKQKCQIENWRYTILEKDINVGLDEITQAVCGNAKRKGKGRNRSW